MRDLAYSAWHRQLDNRLSFLDIDWIERCDACKRPLAVCELAFDNGSQDGHAFYTTQRVARALDMADREGTVRGFLVLYSKDSSGRINAFRVRELHPRESADFTRRTPEEWAQLLYRLRWCHPLAQGVDELAPTMPPRPVVVAVACPKCQLPPLASQPQAFDSRILEHTCEHGHHWWAAA